MKDYDYMLTCTSRPRDPFLVTGERLIDDYVVKMTLGGTDPGSLPELPAVGPWETKSEPIGGTRNENVRKTESRSFRGRLGIATLGGAFLIGPMWLMVLHQTQYTSLISTTVCVVVFGLLMARHLGVMGSTAAYAAVG
jgi:hypothetical protein